LASQEGQLKMMSSDDFKLSESVFLFTHQSHCK
jgi:hypothetical protein